MLTSNTKKNNNNYYYYNITNKFNKIFDLDFI